MVLVLLLSGHVPAFASIGLGLHLAGDHAREEVVLELALAATHGHHHDLDIAPHDHTALRVAVPSAPAPAVAVLADVPAAAASAALVGPTERWDRPPRPGLPELFYQHRALLL